MAAEYYSKDWKIFLQCKECNLFKDIAEDFYTHKEWFLWVLWRCRSCIKAWRKTEHELQMARIRDMERYRNNPKRRADIFESAKKRGKKKWHKPIHTKTTRLINKLWVRPTVCPICLQHSDRIIAHHPDYSKRYEIVFCCQICHDKIHRLKIECPKPIDLLLLPIPNV